MPVHLTNSEQIGFSEQLCDDQKVPYYQVRLYSFFPFFCTGNGNPAVISDIRGNDLERRFSHYVVGGPMTFASE